MLICLVIVKVFTDWILAYKVMYMRIVLTSAKKRKYADRNQWFSSKFCVTLTENPNRHLRWSAVIVEMLLTFNCFRETLHITCLTKTLINKSLYL